MVLYYFFLSLSLVLFLVVVAVVFCSCVFLQLMLSLSLWHCIAVAIVYSIYASWCSSCCSCYCYCVYCFGLQWIVANAATFCGILYLIFSFSFSSTLKKRKLFRTSVFWRLLHTHTHIHIYAYTNLQYHYHVHVVAEFCIQYLLKLVTICVEFANNNEIMFFLFWFTKCKRKQEIRKNKKNNRKMVAFFAITMLT